MRKDRGGAGRLPAFLGTGVMKKFLFIGLLVILRGLILPFVLPFIFTSYLVYGFIRPRISRQMRRDIEDEDDDDSMESVP